MHTSITDTVEALTEGVAKKKIEEDLAKKIAYGNILDYVKVTVEPIEEEE